MHSLLGRQLKRYFGTGVLPDGVDDVHARVQDAFADALAAVARTRAPASLEYALPLPGGEAHYEARRTTQELLDASIIGLPFPQFVLDREHRILYWTRALEEQSGVKAAQVVGTLDHWKAFYPTCRPCLADVVIEGDEAALESWYSGRYWKSSLVAGAYEAMDFIPHARGTGRWLHFGVVAIRDARGVVVGAVESLEDITELVQTQESLSRAQDQLRQSQKLEAVGRLAGGVAHDFNNLLTLIRGRCDLARLHRADETSVQRSLAEIGQAADRAASLTRQLPAYSRQQVLQPKLLDLNHSVRDMDALLRRLIGEHSELCAELEPDLALVMADPGQIEQVIMNLVVNAKDAVARGGRITIGTANVPADDGARRGRVPVPGEPCVLLSVRDDGRGMDERTRACVFDPFFTTKQFGRGTGLGPSTVHGIVEQSRGRIWVDSEVGQGTTFEIHLPEARGRLLAEAEQAAKPMARGRETVLLVEDEDVVRDVAEEMLGLAGYTVLVARDGLEAVRLCDRHEGPIELVMTDLVMPGMGGRELAEEVRVRRPATRILFTSGYTNDPEFRDGATGVGGEFLQKPFSAEVLARTVREVLDAPHETAGAPEDVRTRARAAARP